MVFVKRIIHINKSGLNGGRILVEKVKTLKGRIRSLRLILHTPDNIGTVLPICYIFDYVRRDRHGFCYDGRTTVGEGFINVMADRKTILVREGHRGEEDKGILNDIRKAL